MHPPMTPNPVQYVLCHAKTQLPMYLPRQSTALEKMPRKTGLQTAYGIFLKSNEIQIVCTNQGLVSSSVSMGWGLGLCNSMCPAGM